MSETANSIPASAATVPPMAAATSEWAGVFYGQLAGLVRSGMPLPRALRTLAADIQRSSFKNALIRVAQEIETGTSADTAFARESAHLGGMLARVMAAAASTGRLAELLSELSGWTLTQDRIRRQLTEALTYPYVVLVLASLLMLGLNGALYLSGTVKAYTEFFGATGDTQAMSSMMSNLGISFAVASASFLFAISIPISALAARYSSRIRAWRETLMLRLPVCGAICRPLALSRLCGSTALLLKSGATFHEAVAVAGELTGFEPYRRAAAEASRSLAEGRTLHETWPDRVLFPDSMRFFLSGTEVRGDLSQTLGELAELYRIESEGRGRVLALALPPFCLILVTLVIVTYLVSLLTPMVSLLEHLGSY